MTIYTFCIDSMIWLIDWGYREYQSIWDNPLADGNLLYMWTRNGKFTWSIVGQQHAVVWDRPVIQKIQVRFPDDAVCCCCFLEQELYPHCFSWPSCIIRECEATPVVGFLEQESFSHCSSLLSCNGYLAVLAFTGECKSWTRMKTYFM